MTSALLGRDREMEVIDGLLRDALSSTSSALVVDGEAGIGKTALLEYAMAVASSVEMRVVSITGIESEGGLAFAALHRLLLPLLDLLPTIPGPQQDALAAAFGQRAEPADRFLVGLATLTVLAESAGERPILCVVDDVQWLDPESVDVLGFVARRLHAEGLVVLFGHRDEGNQSSALQGVPSARLGPLTASAAEQLLERLSQGPLLPQTAARILAEAEGYPLALVEMLSEPSVVEPLDGAVQPVSLSLQHRLEQSFVRRVGTLPIDTQTWLLLVAAESSDEADPLRRASLRLGLGVDAAEPATRAGLLTVGQRITFRHPLIRAAVYRSALPAERRRVHQALADVLDGDEDSDRRAWHWAAAIVGPDERVADALEQSALRSQRRGGWCAHAANLRRAADLTPDPEQRSVRYLRAAEAALAAGMPERAEELLDNSSSARSNAAEQAAALRLRAALMLPMQRFAEAPAALLQAARMLVPHDRCRARETLLEAYEVALIAHDSIAATFVADLAQTAAELHEPGVDGPTEELVAGYAALLGGGYREAAPRLRHAVRALIEGDKRDVAVRWVKLGLLAAEVLWDESLFRDWLGLVESHSRGHGALPALRVALEGAANQALWEGRIADAEAAYAESTSIGAAIHPTASPWLNMLVDIACWKGDDDTARASSHSIAHVAAELGVGSAIVAADRAIAILNIGRGRYNDSLGWARRTYAADPPIHGTRSLPDIVEIATRASDGSLASAALARLEQRASASGTVWALGLLARSRALVAEQDAERLYVDSIDLLCETNVQTEIARGHLLYGEWLRRQRRRSHAREQLQAAYEQFTAIGAEAFAERARIELLATGERARRRNLGGLHQDLTPQEAQIARLAADGVTNREIASRLFISANTVDYHLRKVYPKLGISSRHQLGEALRR